MTVKSQNTTPVPNNPLVIIMSNTTPAPDTSSAAPPTTTSIPPPCPPGTEKVPGEEETRSAKKDKSEDGDFPQPKLRLEIRDLSHPGAAKFLSSVNAGTVMSEAVGNVQRLLYRSPADPETTVPATRSVTLILRDMGGVAYTTGTELDSDHKEIHFSLSYINGISPPSRLTSEITGVLTHELVHCYQWDAKGTCPGGLIEGIADWVRLNCDLSPPHWKRETKGSWDGGYQHTAYFLDFLEHRFGTGTVRRINERLRQYKYQAGNFWTDLLGYSVEELWEDYVNTTTK